MILAYRYPTYIVRVASLAAYLNLGNRIPQTHTLPNSCVISSCGTLLVSWLKIKKKIKKKPNACSSYIHVAILVNTLKPGR